jgi:hypothetical protein
MNEFSIIFAFLSGGCILFIALKHRLPLTRIWQSSELDIHLSNREKVIALFGGVFFLLSLIFLLQEYY